VTGYGADGAHAEEPEPVIRDKRRIDPQTGQVREPGAGAAGSSNPFPGRHSAPDPANPSDASQPLRVDLSAAELDIARQEAAERTADLQRVTAEYANYRKRVDRDRDAVVNSAKASVVLELLTVLDDLDRARAHGDLVGSFGAVVGATTGDDIELDFSVLNGPFLVPGIGVQGGTADDVARIFGDTMSAVLPTVSREVLSSGPDVDALRYAAERRIEQFDSLRRG
jgi:hypothetical protein